MAKFTKLGMMLLAAAAALPATTYAQEADVDPTHVIVFMKDDTKQAFAFADKPVVTYVDADMNVAAGEKSVAFTRSDVDHWEFGLDPMAGITDPEAAADALTIDFSNPGVLVLTGAKLTRVALFDAEGRTVAKGVASNGRAEVGVAGLEDSVVIIKADGYKAVKATL